MERLLIKSGEYESSLPFAVGVSLSAGCRTGADIQLGETTDDGPLFATLVNLGGGRVLVADLGMGGVLVNSSPVANQAYDSPIVLTFSDLGLDLHLAIESHRPEASAVPHTFSPEDALPFEQNSSAELSQLAETPLGHPARRPRLHGTVVVLSIIVFLAVIAAGAFVVIRTSHSSIQETQATADAAKPASEMQEANDVQVSPKADAADLLAEGKKLEGEKQTAQAVEKYEQAADLGNAEAWNALGVLTAQEGESKAPVAFGYFSKAAEAGYARGIYNQGLCYLDGIGTAKDQAKAFAMFQQASDLGIPEAMVALAEACETGTGTTADAEKAFQWYQKAADAGNLDAVVALGKAYAEGSGVTRDEAKAAALFEQAAAKDRADAINNLGVLYAKGRGVAKDPDKAKSLYAKAAELGNTEAPDNLKALEQERKPAPSVAESGATRADMRPASSFEEMASTDRANRINKANSGDSDGAKPALTDSAEVSRSPSEQRDDSRVLSFEEAVEKANAGDAYAQAVLSIYYGVGFKTQKDVAKSAAMAMASAKQGHPLGLYRLGVMRQAGAGMQKNEDQGKTLKSQSVKGLNNMQGDPFAMNALATMCYRGEVIRENKPEAARLYALAADQGYAPAQYSYAVCLDRGVGVSKNPDLAKTYLDKAAAQSYPPALAGMPK